MEFAARIAERAALKNPATKRITILGSTGSIGVSTLKLIREASEDFDVECLTAHNNVSLLAQQAIEFSAKRAVIGNASLYDTLKQALSGTGIQAEAGEEALIDAAGTPVDWVMSAIVGAAGLAPTLAAVKTGATIALANKESLVCGGDLVLDNVKKCGATLLPVDSEHNAIFQVFDTHQTEMVERLILTASGGPFLNLTRADMRDVSREQALAHPNWDMGAKISIDSATMMNKGLELIEAYHLFPVEKDQIDILVHPQSVVHSLVEYRDGSTLAQLGSPDMRTPISYALGWPNRHAFKAQKLELGKIGTLTFMDPDFERFPALRLAKSALKTGKSAPAVLNAANEIAVDAFLKGRIGFLEISETVEEVLNKIDFVTFNEIADIFEENRRVRAYTQTALEQRS
ncbi:1-deoxy-D-xylulose-5-phosphate reductoisomerase [Sneathiella aquimaris]|uniref:1-deoxy-D-xylulose-5-phosphate reductoisomerase n=1 Tax=Sneathiella aquimaris TaxID=2599305 RepID=UPI00146D7969|nr:1-deoxy-D-xylulose-5-phosphate reductoisomerase [Sneathiella aquimaris]